MIAPDPVGNMMCFNALMASLTHAGHNASGLEHKFPSGAYLGNLGVSNVFGVLKAELVWSCFEGCSVLWCIWALFIYVVLFGRLRNFLLGEVRSFLWLGFDF